MTYQFDAVLEKGSKTITVPVPDVLQGSEQQRVTITFDVSAEETKAPKKTRVIKGVPISEPFLDTRGWKFDREEANAR